MRKIFFTAFVCFLCAILYGQSDYSIRAAFTGRGISTYYADEQHYQRLDSIWVVNNSKNWERTIVYPDTVLIAIYHNIDNLNVNPIMADALSQNVPNPFDGETEVELYVAENDKVLLQIYDMTGKLYAQDEDRLSAGTYRFSISLTMAQTYLLSAYVGNKSYSIKMVNLGSGGGNSISNLGSVASKLTIENEIYLNETISPSDNMSYIGYTTYNGDVYESRRLSKEWCDGIDTLYFDIPYCDDKITVLDIQDCIPFTYNGQTYSESGHYVLEELQTVCGADSVVELDFRIGGQIETEFYIETNDGEYQWGDTLLRDSGIYRRQFTSIHGCDSIVTLYLTLYVNERTYSCRFSGLGTSTIDGLETHYQQLDSILVVNEEYNRSAQWMLHYPDTTLTTVNLAKLTIVNEGGVPVVLLNGDRISVTGYTTYRGVVYESSVQTDSWGGFGDYIPDYPPSIREAQLYFDIPYCHDRIIVYEIQDCEPYIYNGQTYSESGHYVLEELETVLGCDSIVKLDLTIRDYSFNEIEIHTCDESYQIDDTLITENGVYQRHYTSVHGCDSIVSYIISLGNGFTDERDGNTYCTVQIGDQVWMAENLRYLPNVNSISSMSDNYLNYRWDDTIRCFVYGYDGMDVEEAKMTDNYTKYGVLYKMPMIMAAYYIGDSLMSSDTLCPMGWHIPTDSEWTQLEVFLENNGYNFNGYIDNDELRETHNVMAKSLAYTSDWTVCNESLTVGWLQMKNNTCHFGGMPGGWANVQTGVYAGLHDFGCWWTKTIDSRFLFDENNNMVSTRFFRRLDFDSSSTLRESVDIAKSAMSVRCIRDE